MACTIHVHAALLLIAVLAVSPRECAGRLSSVVVVSRHSVKSINYTAEFSRHFDATLAMTRGMKGTVTPHGRQYASLVGRCERHTHSCFAVSVPLWHHSSRLV